VFSIISLHFRIKPVQQWKLINYTIYHLNDPLFNLSNSRARPFGSLNIRSINVWGSLAYAFGYDLSCYISFLSSLFSISARAMSSYNVDISDNKVCWSYWLFWWTTCPLAESLILKSTKFIESSFIGVVDGGVIAGRILNDDVSG